MQNLKQVYKTLAKTWRPPPDLQIDSWSDQYRKLSSESSPEPGQWRTDRVPFQREIMKVINDTNVEEVTFIKSAQVGATELLLNTIGYFIDQEPAPILVMQPTLAMAQTFSKDRLAPMLRDTTKLKGKVKDPKTRDGENTTLHKKFPGGHITVVGANSSSGLRSRPIRILLCDEVDSYPPSAGTEGDPINLAKKRTTVFPNRKVILVSTPTIKGLSRIERAYEESDQRIYLVPCPECEHKQQLLWKNVIWDEGKPDTATLVCDSCGSVIPESKKQWMLMNGEWQSTKESKKIGFHISELYSPFRTIKEIVSDFLQAKRTPETLQTFINTTLGETYEDQGESIKADYLLEMCENYNHEAIPGDILFLTAGVDTQKDRLEVQVLGIGEDFETWVVEYKIIWGNPSTKETWMELDAFLKTTYATQDGRRLPIVCTCIDSGGLHTDMVYQFTKERQARRIFAIKGQSQAGKPIAGKPSFVTGRKVALYPVGSDTGKEWIYARINNEDRKLIHFPNTLDEEYFKQLSSEKKITKKYMGRDIVKWIQTRKRNEALDTMIYGVAAAYILQPNFEKLKLEPKSTNIQKNQKNQEPSVIMRRRLSRKSPRNFVNAWKD